MPLNDQTKAAFKDAYLNEDLTALQTILTKIEHKDFKELLAIEITVNGKKISIDQDIENSETPAELYVLNHYNVQNNVQIDLDKIVAFDQNPLAQNSATAADALVALEKIAKTSEFIANPAAYLGTDKTRLDALERVYKAQNPGKSYMTNSKANHATVSTNPRYIGKTTGNMYYYDSSNAVGSAIQATKLVAAEVEAVRVENARVEQIRLAEVEAVKRFEELPEFEAAGKGTTFIQKGQVAGISTATHQANVAREYAEREEAKLSAVPLGGTGAALEGGVSLVSDPAQALLKRATIPITTERRSPKAKSFKPDLNDAPSLVTLSSEPITAAGVLNAGGSLPADQLPIAYFPADQLPIAYLASIVYLGASEESKLLVFADIKRAILGEQDIPQLKTKLLKAFNEFFPNEEVTEQDVLAFQIDLAMKGPNNLLNQLTAAEASLISPALISATADVILPPQMDGARREILTEMQTDINADEVLQAQKLEEAEDLLVDNVVNPTTAKGMTTEEIALALGMSTKEVEEIPDIGLTARDNIETKALEGRREAAASTLQKIFRNRKIDQQFKKDVALGKIVTGAITKEKALNSEFNNYVKNNDLAGLTKLIEANPTFSVLNPREVTGGKFTTHRKPAIKAAMVNAMDESTADTRAMRNYLNRLVLRDKIRLGDLSDQELGQALLNIGDEQSIDGTILVKAIDRKLPGVDVTPFQYAAEKGRFMIVDDLADRGALDQNNPVVIEALAKANNVDAVERLIIRNAPYNLIKSIPQVPKGTDEKALLVDGEPMNSAQRMIAVMNTPKLLLGDARDKAFQENIEARQRLQQDYKQARKMMRDAYRAMVYTGSVSLDALSFGVYKAKEGAAYLGTKTAEGAQYLWDNKVAIAQGAGTGLKSGAIVAGLAVAATVATVVTAIDFTVAGAIWTTARIAAATSRAIEDSITTVGHTVLSAGRSANLLWNDSTVRARTGEVDALIDRAIKGLDQNAVSTKEVKLAMETLKAQEKEYFTVKTEAERRDLFNTMTMTRQAIIEDIKGPAGAMFTERLNLKNAQCINAVEANLLTRSDMVNKAKTVKSDRQEKVDLRVDNDKWRTEIIGKYTGATFLLEKIVNAALGTPERAAEKEHQAFMQDTGLKETTDKGKSLNDGTDEKMLEMRERRTAALKKMPENLEEFNRKTAPSPTVIIPAAKPLDRTTIDIKSVKVMTAEEQAIAAAKSFKGTRAVDIDNSSFDARTITAPNTPPKAKEMDDLGKKPSGGKSWTR